MDETSYRRKVALTTNVRESQRLEKVNKHYEKLKIENSSNHSREEREMRQMLRRLEREKEDSRAEVENVKHYLGEIEQAERDRARTRDPATRRRLSKKCKIGIQKLFQNTKLHHGAELDPQRMSPPNSHDVAMRLLAEANSHRTKSSRYKHDKAAPTRRATIAATEAQILTVNHHGPLIPSEKRRSVPGGLKVTTMPPPEDGGTVATSSSGLKLPRISPSSRHSLTGKDSSEDHQPGGSSSTEAFHRRVNFTPREGATNNMFTHSPDTSQMTHMPSRIRRQSLNIPMPMTDEREHLRKLAARPVMSMPATSNRQRRHTVAHLELGEEAEEKDELSMQALERYYTLLAENEQEMRQKDSDFSIPGGFHGSLSTLRRSHRRKLLALEALLKQLPSFKKKNQNILDHIDALNCRYLRLPQHTIEELEELCRMAGIEPGIHSHMTEEQVQDYLDDTPHSSHPNSAKHRTSWDAASSSTQQIHHR